MDSYDLLHNPPISYRTKSGSHREVGVITSHLTQPPLKVAHQLTPGPFCHSLSVGLAPTSD